MQELTGDFYFMLPKDGKVSLLMMKFENRTLNIPASDFLVFHTSSSMLLSGWCIWWHIVLSMNSQVEPYARSVNETWQV